MSPWNAYLEDITFSFRKQKELAEKAFRQVADDSLEERDVDRGHRFGDAVAAAGLMSMGSWIMTFSTFDQKGKQLEKRVPAARPPKAMERPSASRSVGANHVSRIGSTTFLWPDLPRGCASLMLTAWIPSSSTTETRYVRVQRSRQLWSRERVARAPVLNEQRARQGIGTSVGWWRGCRMGRGFFPAAWSIPMWRRRASRRGAAATLSMSP